MKQCLKLLFLKKCFFSSVFGVIDTSQTKRLVLQRPDLTPPPPASGCTAHRSDRFSLRETKGISPSMLASQCRGVISLVEKEMFQDLLSAQELGPHGHTCFTDMAST